MWPSIMSSETLHYRSCNACSVLCSESCQEECYQHTGVHRMHCLYMISQSPPTIRSHCPPVRNWKCRDTCPYTVRAHNTHTWPEVMTWYWWYYPRDFECCSIQQLACDWKCIRRATGAQRFNIELDQIVVTKYCCKQVRVAIDKEGSWSLRRGRSRLILLSVLHHFEHDRIREATEGCHGGLKMSATNIEGDKVIRRRWGDHWHCTGRWWKV